MRVLVVPLLMLAGCSDPFRPVDEGALWLLEASDDVFFHHAAEVKISSLEGKPALNPRGFLVGEQMMRLILRRTQRGEEGPLRESERFSVAAGREVRAGVEGAFDLRFTTHPRGEGQTVDYHFAWAGGAPVVGTLDLPPRGVMGFLKPNGDKRYTLLLVALYQPDP